MRTRFVLVEHGIDIAKILLRPEEPLTEAIACIDRSNGEIALVVDGERRLVGTVTDGDIRRALLRGRTLQDDVGSIMNQRPRSTRSGQPRGAMREFMLRNDVKQLPIVDDDGRLIDLVLLRELLEAADHPNQVVLMVGGLGTRLLPMTENTPKALIPIGGKPILQTIVEGFVSQGFSRFTLSLNHLGDKIECHFGDGSRFGAEISYVREAKRLGTAGALSLLAERPSEPIFVMNGDILTSTNFSAMLQFHAKLGALATMGVNHFHYKVPYGVIEVDEERITALVEKPEYDFFVNSGIYVLSPEAIDEIPHDEFFDMPSLFQALIDKGQPTAAFPIHEQWLDIGQPNDLKRAYDEYETVSNEHSRRHRSRSSDGIER